MKTYTVTCDFFIEAESEEEAHERLLEYLAEYVQHGDLTGFDFKEQEAT